MTIVAIHQPQYLPWLPYCAKAASCNLFVYLDNVQFQKNGVQNRNQILTANGPMWLTVPVRASLETTIQQTPIDNTQPWRQKHFRSIEMAYARAPHKQLIEEELRQLIESDWSYLADLNIALTEWMFSQLGIKCQRIRASELSVNGAKDDLVLDICKALKASVYLSGQGAKTYQNEAKFKELGVELHYHVYENPIYSQCHAHTNNKFIPNLSALDLLLNMGVNSRQIMQSGQLSEKGLCHV